ncbi:signal peptidase I [uncultured Tenacibaculum sp.]|uniref:signal peptidase I n=1 Tax=uncultured Tenacibaculum sp. TaxID=174713 RepID=UPI00262C9CBC|nr:signal peptidase I [uncultured Tenacibaculum sp.]
MKKIASLLFYTLGFLIIFLFFVWSKLIIVSTILLLILDSFTKQIVSKLLKKYISTSIYKIVTYSYIILLPLFIAVFFRTFFIDVYYVPSSSMEATLFPGDYVLINKFSYGVRVPKHLRNTPVIGSFFSPPENNYNLYTSLSSFEELEKEDIVVFKAVDDSDKFLIKRIIGMPSDTIEIKNSIVLVNSKKAKEKDNYSYNYIYEQGNKLSLFKNYSNKEFAKFSTINKGKYKKDLQLKPNNNYFIFPSKKHDSWTKDNYGKLIIPKKGMKIFLTQENIAIYKNVVQKFENVILRNLKTNTYTFKKDYYFMMGDNRHNSVDSRSFGFVPESYIQGKMIKIL